MKSWGAPPLLTSRFEVITKEKGEGRFPGSAATHCRSLRALQWWFQFLRTMSLCSAVWYEMHSWRRCAALKTGCQNKTPYWQKTSWGQQGRNHILTPFCGLSRSFTKRSYAFICHVGQQQKIYIQFTLCVDDCPPHQNIVPHPKPLPQCWKRQRYPSILPFDISITRKHENMPSGIHL